MSAGGERLFEEATVIFQRANQCALCARFLGEGACAAFPGGIPADLLSGRVLHRDPYPGDQGISFYLKQAPLTREDPRFSGAG